MFDQTRAADQLKESTLRMQAEAMAFLEQAQAAGNKKEARIWASELRKVNKLISDYGFNRNA